MACPNAVLRWSISHTQEQDRSSSPLRSGAYLFVAVRLSPLRDEARACREASAAALDSAEHTPTAGSAERGRGDRGGSRIETLQRHALELVDPEA